jgi:hypothetical protein
MTTDGNELTTVRVAKNRDAGSHNCRFQNLMPYTPGIYQKEIETDF